MFLFNTSALFFVILGLYFLAALLALIFQKNDRCANIISNLLCISAAAIGILTSIVFLVSGSERVDIANIKLFIPFASIHISLDNLSAFFILILSLLVLCVSIYSIGYISHYYGKRNVGIFNFLYSFFILTMLLVFTAANTVFFFIAWEAMSLVSYFLVVFESEHVENQKAGTIYIIMTHLGAAFLLIAFMVMYSYTNSFDISGDSGAIPLFVKSILFILFLIGFGTKAGVIPLHIWLPYAHPAAPSNVSALMSGIMIKTAVYGLIRFVLCYLNVQYTWWGVLILIVGGISAVLGVAYALMEHNIKKLLAFSSVENIGIILIGLGICFIAVAQKNVFLGGLALAATLFHTLNHALFKGGLFLGAGSIQYSTHTKDMEELGGLIKKMPLTALFVLCFSLAISAIVPFNGFVSEWMTYQALLANITLGQAGINIISILSVAALALSGALAAACFVKMFGISFLGLPRSDHAANAKEVPKIMNIGMGIIALSCIVLGVFPVLFIKLIDNLILGLVGKSIAGQLQGGFLIVNSPLMLSGNSIYPAAILVILIAVILAVFIILKVTGRRYPERKTGTWDCGFKALNSRMQYSATGFSKPLRIVFKILYRPGRELNMEEGESPYFPSSMKYRVYIESIFEKYFYGPVLGAIKNFTRKTKYSIQTGSVHKYLLYIFITLLALMLYNRLG